MKQSTLNFSSAKRVGSSNTGKSKTSSSKAPQDVEVSSANSAKPNDLEKSYDDIILADRDKEETLDEGKANVDAQPKPDPKKSETASVGRATRSASNKATTTLKKPLHDLEESEAEKASHRQQSTTLPEDGVKKATVATQKEDVADLPELNVKDPKFRKIYAEVKEKMGGLPAIHGEKQNRIHEILRVFDNSYEYGPCVGISRRDRWDRAQALGLNPPKEINDILNTKEGTTLTEYSQSVFYGEV
ncbi:hypothetical protein GALMADRAFT_241287 [Galerina marginata CBS 339.88]|uniref:DNA polymerase delta subunit 4 n=1 Tax=Galerina marginata (strain CBS 339.88) TaxID=685588 RepID=A0A067TEP7_GALM3|nr:hypothetical protein GALMADRAFT_241287 [Galerina marginata CBS 339.88]